MMHDTRYSIHDPRYTIHETRDTPDTSHETRDTRDTSYEARDTRHQTRDTIPDGQYTIRHEAKPSSVTFSDSGSDGSADAKAPSRATAETRPSLSFPAVTPAARSLPASSGAAERTLVPNRRPPDTPTVAKLMHELEVVRGERDQSKRERDQLEEEIQIVEVERDEAQFELGTAQQEYKSLLAQNVRLQAENEHLENLTTQLESRLALTSTDPVALALTSTDSVALALTSTDSVAPRPAAGRPGRPNADVDHPGRPRSDSKPAPGAAPTPAAHAKPALDDSSDASSGASSDSEPELELLSVESKYMSSSVQDREHVKAVSEATGVDPAGLVALRRYLYTAEKIDRRTENKETSPKYAMLAGQNAAEGLAIPEGLYSEDAHTRGMAYKNLFRGDLAGLLDSKLSVGAPWLDVLRSLRTRFQAADHQLLAQHTLVAMRDVQLHNAELLHAEAFLFKLDGVFYSATKGLSDFDQITSRSPTMNAASLLASIVDAYLQQQDDPKLTRKNVLHDKNRRRELFKKARTCLLNDERDAERGKYIHEEFNKLWGTLNIQCDRYPTKTRLAALDLQRFGENQLKDAEERFERERADKRDLPPDLVRRADRTVATAPWPNSRADSDAGSDLHSEDGSCHGSHRPHRPKGQGAQKRRNERWSAGHQQPSRHATESYRYD